MYVYRKSLHSAQWKHCEPLLKTNRWIEKVLIILIWCVFKMTSDGLRWWWYGQDRHYSESLNADAAAAANRQLIIQRNNNKKTTAPKPTHLP